MSQAGNVWHGPGIIKKQKTVNEGDKETQNNYIPPIMEVTDVATIIVPLPSISISCHTIRFMDNSQITVE